MVGDYEIRMYERSMKKAQRILRNRKWALFFASRPRMKPKETRPFIVIVHLLRKETRFTKSTAYSFHLEEEESQKKNESDA